MGKSPAVAVPDVQLQSNLRRALSEHDSDACKEVVWME